MSLTTYGALKTSLADWSNRADLTSQVPDFVTWAHQEIGRRLRAPVLYAWADVTVDAEAVTAPTGFLAAKRFYLDLSPRKALKVTDSANLADMAALYASQTYPEWFAVEGTSTLAFAPLFTGSVTGKLMYYKEPDVLSDDEDTNVVLAKYPYLYLYGGLEALFRFLNDAGNTDRYGQLFGALIESINAEEAKDATRGPLAIVSGSAVV